MNSNKVFQFIIGTSIVLVVAIFFMYPANNWPGGMTAIACLLSLLALVPVLIFISWKNNKWLNDAQKQSTAAGLVFGSLWTAEISMNNIIQPGLPLRDRLDDMFWPLVALLILGFAIRASMRTRKISAGLLAGFWSSLGSGATACITALFLITAGMHFIATEPVNQQEWAGLAAGGVKKGMYTHDMANYFAYQSLTGAIMHLKVQGGFMGLLLGLKGGGAGKLAGSLIRRKNVNQQNRAN